MRVLTPPAEPELRYVILAAKDRKELRRALKGAKGAAAELRRLLK